MTLRPPHAPRTNPLCPYTTPCQSASPTTTTAERVAGLRPPFRRHSGRPARLGYRDRPPRRLDRPPPPRSREPAKAMRRRPHRSRRSEEHTSELQSLMRNSSAGFILDKKQPNI